MRPHVIALLLTAVISSASAAEPSSSGSEAFPAELTASSGLSPEDFAAINRCAQAAIFSIQALELEPSSPEARTAFLMGALDNKQLKERYRERMPTPANVVMAQSAIDAMVKKDGAPKAAIDFHMLAASAAAACAVHARLPGRA